MNVLDALYQPKPRLIERHCGGWLAVTPRNWPLAVGVESDTQEGAVIAFQAEMERWSRIETKPDNPVSPRS